jgi:hypothetical protein
MRGAGIFNKPRVAGQVVHTPIFNKSWRIACLGRRGALRCNLVIVQT